MGDTTKVSGIEPVSSRRLKMLMLPDWRSTNPYQQLLADAAAKHGIDVLFSAYHPPLLPVFRLVRRLKVDVLHLHWLDQYCLRPSLAATLIFTTRFLLDLALIRAKGIPILWTVHNLVTHETRFPRLERLLYRAVGRLADQVLVHQHSSLKTVGQAYGVPDHKFSVVPIVHYRGVYCEACDVRRARQELALPDTGKVFLHQGLLRPYKGVEELLSAWVKSGLGQRGHSLLIAGRANEPSYEEELAALARGVENVMFHAGFIDPSRMHLYFSAADIVVLPFRRVLNTSSVVLAMSYGKPVIAPRINTIEELLCQADDLLYGHEDPDGLVDALHRSLTADLPGLSERVTTACDALDHDSIGAMLARNVRRLVHSFLVITEACNSTASALIQ